MNHSYPILTVFSAFAVDIFNFLSKEVGDTKPNKGSPAEIKLGCKLKAIVDQACKLAAEQDQRVGLATDENQLTDDSAAGQMMSVWVSLKTLSNEFSETLCTRGVALVKMITNTDHSNKSKLESLDALGSDLPQGIKDYVDAARLLCSSIALPSDLKSDMLGALKQYMKVQPISAAILGELAGPTHKVEQYAKFVTDFENGFKDGGW